MTKRLLWPAAGLAIAATLFAAEDAKTVLENAQKAMGDLKSVQFSATGRNGFFGQALIAGQEWPMRDLVSYTQAINYQQKSDRIDLVFKEMVFGGIRQNTEVNGDKAWTTGMNGRANPQLAAADERELQIWMTPEGFVQAALGAGNATVKSKSENGKKVNLVTFTAMNKYKLTGTIDSDGMVAKVETRFPDPVMGDMDYSFAYSDYKDFGGVKFPMKILQSEGGFPVNDLTVTNVMPNAPVDFPVPANVATATIAPMTAPSTKLADGVWLVTGGYNSLVVEFDKYITVVEGGQNEKRSLAVIAEAKKLVPNKPIKYLVSTHNHFDHSGGLRTYVAEGATIVMAASSKPFFEKTFMAPAIIEPDEQSKMHKKPSIVGVTDKYVITDGKMSIDVYNTIGDQHVHDLLIAYVLPARILEEADSFSPGPPNAPPPNPVPPNALVLYDNIKRLNLDPVTIVGVHGRGAAPMAEFLKFVGKS